ncbi:MAG TPA: hypothetical protein VIE39_02925 [Thermoanaerobaculia bacterium]|jgi:hypothetical protein
MDVFFGALVVLMLLGAVLYPRLREAATAWRRARDRRVIVCPETGRAEGVALDSTGAAKAAFLGGESFQLSSCTRWPERAGCGQECLSQIASTPDGCSIRARLEQWYSGKRCAFCGLSFTAIGWLDHKPGLLDPQRNVVEWSDIRAEALPEALERCRPICWNCTMAEGFRIRHPELVIDDPLRRAPPRDRTVGT